MDYRRYIYIEVYMTQFLGFLFNFKLALHCVVTTPQEGQLYYFFISDYYILFWRNSEVFLRVMSKEMKAEK